MTLRAIASFFSDPSKCYAGCKDFDYQDLIVTKCNHLFCRACLEPWLGTKPNCPLDNKDLSLITSNNVRHRNEDPMINETSINKGMQYSSFKLHLETFSYYIQKDFSTVQEKMTTMNISSGEQLKDKTQSNKDECSICQNSIPQMHFITQGRTGVGHFMHEGCLDKKIDTKNYISISARDMVLVAKELSPPRKEPIKPGSPINFLFMAITPVVSLWAFMMNTRVYHNKSFTLFVLSTPILILRFILNGLKTVFTAKPI